MKVKQKIPWREAMDLANLLSATLQRPHTEEDFPPIVCGSIRRGLKMVADIDFVVAPPLKASVDALMEGDAEYLSGGSKKAHLRVRGVQVDLYVAEREEYGAMVMFLTGSPEFNIWMRAKAKAKRMKLSQYGLYSLERGKLVASRSEKEIFQALGMKIYRPSERERNWSW